MTGHPQNTYDWLNTLDGLPPAGAECLLSLNGQQSEKAIITYMGDGVFCYRKASTLKEYTGSIYDAKFRPLPRTVRVSGEVPESVIKLARDWEKSVSAGPIARALLSLVEESE